MQCHLAFEILELSGPNQSLSSLGLTDALSWIELPLKCLRCSLHDSDTVQVCPFSHLLVPAVIW